MINIYSVQLDLEEKGWQLLSTEYKNLKSELRMKCPKGHEIQMSYEQWRKHPVCEKCFAGKPYKERLQVPPKRDGVKRLLALDAATNTSGYSIYDNDELVGYGSYTAPAEKDSTERINDVKKWLETMIETYKPDFVGIEHIQLQTFGQKNQVELYRVLANLQGVLRDTLYELQIPNDLVYPSMWRKDCGVSGKGRAEQKRAAQDKAMTWYSISATQDEADAICIGKYFVNALNNKNKASWGEPI